MIETFNHEKNPKSRRTLPSAGFAFFFLLLSFIAGLKEKNSVYAVSEFQTRYSGFCQFRENGDAEFSYEIKITNNFSNIYPKEYYLSLDGANVENISAWDAKGNILRDIETGNERTTIRLGFNEESVGKEKTLIFNINYKIDKLAVKKGSVWEVFLPKLSDLDRIDDYRIKILIPKKYGRLSSANISMKETTEIENGYEFLLDKETIIKNKGVLLTFGDFQLFDFRLKYQLGNNSNRNPVEIEIALPPDTNYQTVILKKIDPFPKEIKTDVDGNWLALYSLLPKERRNIVVEGQVKIFSQPKQFDTPKNLSKYLQSSLYWPVNDPEIVKTAKTLSSVEDIYNFVINHLKYPEEIPSGANLIRKGGKVALEDPKNSVCTEFTDLFITLARAAGIPAREIQGFAYTNNPKIRSLASVNDILHSWPEYWNQKQNSWIQIDPSWEKTTKGIDYFSRFDFNHFAFVVHGENSDSPIPAGAYKIDDDKSVEVTPAEIAIPEPNQNFRVFLTYDNHDPDYLEIRVVNQSLMAAYNTQVVINVPSGRAIVQERKEVPKVIPLGEVILRVRKPKAWTLFFKSKIEVLINNNKIVLPIPIGSYLKTALILLTSLLFVLIFIPLLIFKLK